MGINRENIEKEERELRGGGVEPGWERMEQAAQQAKREAEQNPPWNEGQEQHEEVPEDERLERPVGTETINY